MATRYRKSQIAASLLACALPSSPGIAHHTPGHTEQERVQQLMNDNARRQQEETNRAVRSMMPKGSSDDSTTRSSGGSTYGGSSTSRSSGPDPAQLCKAHPLRAGDRNPLIGKWLPANAKAGDALTALFQMMAQPQCGMFQAGAEFRERTFVNVLAEVPVQYGRKGDTWLACLPASEVRAVAFRVQDANHIKTTDEPACVLRRESAAEAQAVQTLAAMSGSAAIAGGAALAFTAATASPSGTAVPASDRSFFVLKDSIESVMAQAGIQPTPGGSRVKAWSMACESNAPACNQGSKALMAASVSIAKTDASGRGRVTPVAPGTYYLFGTAESSAQPIIWDVKIDLRPGDNNMVLDQRNAMPIN